jgi:hypothetical protein
MICDPEFRWALSSVGWVDGDALWIFDLARGEPRTMPCGSGATYLTLHGSPGWDRFAVAHHFGSDRFEVTVRRFAEPATVLGRAVVGPNSIGGAAARRLEGEPSAWRGLPWLYVAHLAAPPWQDYVLVRVSPARGEVAIRRLDWFGAGYDKAYQGVVGVTAFGHEALFAVQRSSTLIAEDLDAAGRWRSIELAGRGGNPQLALRDGDRELWAMDYDTLVVVDPARGERLRAQRVQESRNGVREFAGDFCFTPEGDRCLVARPFGGDVAILDPLTLRPTGTVTCGQQPLELLALPERAFLARDWKTGAPLRGRWKRRLFGR